MVDAGDAEAEVGDDCAQEVGADDDQQGEEEVEEGEQEERV